MSISFFGPRVWAHLWIYTNEFYGNLDKTAAPNDGIFIKNANEYKAIFYSPKEKRFVQYDQYTPEQVQNIEKNIKDNPYNGESDEDTSSEEANSETSESAKSMNDKEPTQ